MSKHIIISGGGTGGHIFPAIAIANALKKMEPSIDILFVGAKGRMEMEKVPQAGYPIEGLDIAGFNRSHLLKNISLPYKIIKSFLQVRKVFKRFKPHAVIGVGGYASFPVLQYAQFAGIPAFIHESNSFAGKANKMLGKKAAKIFVATDGMEQFFPREKLQVTGNPVRPAIKNVKHINKEEALSFFGMKPGKTTLLVVGGSLGARSVNEAIAAGLETILGEGIQLIWQTGKTDAGKWKAGVKDDAVWVNDFINQMELAYAAADMVVSRAGAMAIAELCVVGKPVIFVPYPFAAEDHQTVNALNLVNKHAALMVKDHEVKDKLVAAVIALNANGNLQIELQKNIEPFAVYNADEQVAATVLKKINQ